MTATLSGVEAGKVSCCANLLDGRVYCWGSEILPAATAFVPFLAFDHGPYKKISVSAHLCALSSSRHVECNDQWDEDVERDGIIDISAGVSSLCLLTQDHRILCKGDNTEAQLGNGTLGPGSMDLVEVHLPVSH